MRKKPAAKPLPGSRKRSSPGTDARYDKLYIFERITERTWWSNFALMHEIKIGVTGKDAEIRRFGVDEGTPGDVVCIHVLFIPGRAYTHEQRLHRKYKDRSFVPKGTKKGAGRTEWFRVNSFVYMVILFDFFWIAWGRTIVWISLLLFISWWAYLMFLMPPVKIITE